MVEKVFGGGRRGVSDMIKELHTHHRERMRERYAKTGFDSFADHEILEMLLYRVNRRSDTNPTAHRLLEGYGGSLSRVLFDRERQSIEGVGTATEDMLAACAFSMVGMLVETLRMEAIVTDQAARVFFDSLHTLSLVPPNCAVILACPLDGAYDAWRIVDLKECPDAASFADFLRTQFAPARLFRIAQHGDGLFMDAAMEEDVRNRCAANYGFLKSCAIL